MRLKSIFSSLSGKPARESRPQPARNQCRYILDSGSRCRRQPSVTGSGLCLHHENHILQLRQGESQQLAAEALAGVADFTSVLAINRVLGRILALALERRYSPRELDSFTRTLRLLYKTQSDCEFDLQSHHRLAPTRTNTHPPALDHSSTQAEPQHSVVAARLASPGSPEANQQAESTGPTAATNCGTVALQSAAAFSDDSTSAPESATPRSVAPTAPTVTITSPNPNSHPSSSDHIVWLGPKPSPTHAHSS